MIYEDRPSALLEAQSLEVHVSAVEKAQAHDLGVVTLCYTATGAFRISSTKTNCSFVVGLLTRAAMELHLSLREQCPLTVVAEKPVATVSAKSDLLELERRIALAKSIADNCSGDYMRSVLDGEIDAEEHERRFIR